MDLYQAGRLQEELANPNVPVVTGADLWDLPAKFETAMYPAPRGGERLLKLDMVEQTFHILRPGGQLIVLSPYAGDDFFPDALKKIFGRVHQPPADGGQVFWCRRQGDRPRRRHQVTFKARMKDGVSLRFLSRPGVFSHGRFDDGARALVETMTIDPGNRILDMGCGCGTNGVWAGRLAGSMGHVTFIDSNLRALALAEHNAQENGLANFKTVPSTSIDQLPRQSFDVALANPPYYAQLAIAQLFIDQCQALLRPQGRFFLVTKQPNQVEPLVEAAFSQVERVPRRGYVVLSARCP
jgi:16S rRNA (guanine1207-N2)-methyltransferase